MAINAELKKQAKEDKKRAKELNNKKKLREMEYNCFYDKKQNAENARQKLMEISTEMFDLYTSGAKADKKNALISLRYIAISATLEEFKPRLKEIEKIAKYQDLGKIADEIGEILRYRTIEDRLYKDQLSRNFLALGDVIFKQKGSDIWKNTCDLSYYLATSSTVIDRKAVERAMKYNDFYGERMRACKDLLARLDDPEYAKKKKAEDKAKAEKLKKGDYDVPTLNEVLPPKYANFLQDDETVFAKSHLHPACCPSCGYKPMPKAKAKTKGDVTTVEHSCPRCSFSYKAIETFTKKTNFDGAYDRTYDIVKYTYEPITTPRKQEVADLLKKMATEKDFLQRSSYIDTTPTINVNIHID